ncbi:MAG: HipA domain-containing protein [Epsilonproteobacteria bacterium]|nr:HipA domain-containing protein [Campylobacterota bacterium]
MDSVEVWAWGEKVGIVIQEGNSIVFELLNNKFKRISPMLFETSLAAKADVNEIHRIGPIADALPGGYGMDYLGKYFTDEFGRKPSIVESLSFVGKHGLGALEFKPESSTTRIDQELFATLEELKIQSRAIYEGVHRYDVGKLIAVSNSAAGGARAKAVVGFNPNNQQIHIAQKHDIEPDGYLKCIIKFNPKKDKEKIEEYNQELRAEYLYAQLAKKTGIEMSKVWLFDDNGANYFVTERFDVDKKGKRFHLHSFAGLIGSDASSFSTSYDALFRVGSALGIPKYDKEQMFKLMVFNLVFSNRDDHARNFSFLMDDNGLWRFAPAYDLTFSVHNYGANHHQLKIDKKLAHQIRSISLNKVARLCEVNNPLDIVADMIEMKHSWLPDMAHENNLASSFVSAVLDATKDIDKTFGK